MGIFSKLFGKKKPSNINQATPSTDIAVRNTPIQSERTILSIHPDIRDLLWIGDGKYKNYIPTPLKRNTISSNGISFTVSFSEEDEPSLIFLRLPISNTTEAVERPPYYPTYKGLSPKQRGVYWRLLANPYDSTIDIGYVFILYYGLERYLLTDKYEEAINVIIKLRDVHTNKSFQMYTANAIILTCLTKQRADIVQYFMDSLDKEHEFNFSSNLFLLCKYALGLPLTASDVMRMAKSFDFTKNNYIKKYPDMFLKMLSLNIIEKYKEDTIPWDKLISNTEFRKLPTEETPIFANVSIWDKTIQVVSLLASFRLKKTIYDLLDKTHEDIKQRLSEMKREGITVSEVAKPFSDKKPKEVQTFDKAQERKLLHDYNMAKDNSLEQHFASIALQDFYYKYRDLDCIYLDKCIEYCQDDIAKLPDIQKKYIEDMRRRTLSYSSSLTPVEIQQKLSSIDPFTGSIPAFKRLAIIYEKRKDYKSAINMCDRAIAYYSSINLQSLVSEFEERRQKLINKSRD